MEVLYTATPIVLVAVLFALSVAGQGTVTDTTDEPDVRVEVVGFQWQWQFRYPDQDVVVSGSTDRPALLVLPVDRTSQLDLVSADVNHSFWVPEFLSKRDLIIGIDNVIDVTPTETGSWLGRCAEYCGLDHWRMYFEVHVVAPDEFERWAEEAAQAEPTAVPRPDGVTAP
jgi:cytochrome c oxidase subunit 2